MRALMRSLGVVWGRSGSALYLAAIQTDPMMKRSSRIPCPHSAPVSHHCWIAQIAKGSPMRIPTPLIVRRMFWRPIARKR